MKPVPVNTYVKALNAFCRRLHEEGHHAVRLELSLLKLEKRVLQTLTDEQMTTLLARKPKGFVANRLHALIAFVLDTGVRIDEALTVRASATRSSRCSARVARNAESRSRSSCGRCSTAMNGSGRRARRSVSCCSRR
ncbi:MAG TPA: hypothetical protein VNG89_21670 [Vicinamibacterales bacterium]|nr:hypothetical protein [Vicinamibacterales bacterium]